MGGGGRDVAGGEGPLARTVATPPFYRSGYKRVSLVGGPDVLALTLLVVTGITPLRRRNQPSRLRLVCRKAH